MLNSLYKDYFQKSKAFLYPALTISKKSSVSPIMTYIALNDMYSEKDMKLICEFHLRSDVEYRTFEKNKLLGNALFHEFHEMGDGTGLYVFDFSSYADDWSLFLDGKYSKLGHVLKGYIYNHHQSNKYHRQYIETYLNPEEYYDVYSKLLGCDPQLLKSVGELCDKPDLVKERLQVEIKDVTLDLLKSKLQKL
jgi:hypothetical protein